MRHVGQRAVLAVEHGVEQLPQPVAAAGHADQSVVRGPSSFFSFSAYIGSMLDVSKGIPMMKPQA